jgi:hypothetical protein
MNRSKQLQKLPACFRRNSGAIQIRHANTYSYGKLAKFPDNRPE